MKCVDVHDGQIIMGDYQVGGKALLSGHDPFYQRNMAMCRECLRLLSEFYPGYDWEVTADYDQGVVMIALPLLMGGTFKYVIHIDAVATANDMTKRVREAGGNILERFRLSRKGLIMPEYQDALAKRGNLPRFESVPE